MIGSFFIEEAEKECDSCYSINAFDYIGLMEHENYMGGLYNNETVGNIVADILSGISYSIDETLASRTVSGLLEIQSKREALQKVIFCAGGIINCSRTNMIELKTLSEDIKSTIDKDRIVSLTEIIESITTSIEITFHSYIKQTNENELFNASITGETLITFGAPYHSLRITNGTIITSNSNYAIISGTGNVVVYGKGYEDVTTIKSKRNPLISSTDTEKMKSYESTLVCNEIELLDYLKFINKYLKFKFNLNNDEQVGDKVNVIGKTARITSLSYNLNTISVFATAEAEIED